MKRIKTAAFLFLVCVLTLCGCHTAHQEATWEYKQIYAHLSDRQLNDYAKQGWLVDQIVKGREQSSEWVYILLKKRVPEQSTPPHP